MNKRYIDFVPTNTSKTAKSSRRSGVHVQMPDAKPVSRRTVSRGTVAATPRVHSASTGVKVQSRSTSSYNSSLASRGTSTVAKAPALGVVEDLNGKFVKTDVPKRPLGDGKKSATKAKGEVEVAKSRRLIGRRANKTSGEVSSSNVKTKKDNSKYKPPKTPFINQEKVVKRPLSKNVYQKKAVTPKETPSKPVAIITKPEKESYVGVVIAVIVTIILGAAAGTIAFLLLPK